MQDVSWNPAYLPALKSYLDRARQEINVNNIIYLVGLVVIVFAILSFFGLR